MSILGKYNKDAFSFRMIIVWKYLQSQVFLAIFSLMGFPSISEEDLTFELVKRYSASDHCLRNPLPSHINMPRAGMFSAVALISTLHISHVSK
jgi:hypothetical protein